MAYKDIISARDPKSVGGKKDTRLVLVMMMMMMMMTHRCEHIGADICEHMIADISEHTYGTPFPGTAFCASLRSRNAHGHFTRAILCGNLQGKNAAHYSAYLD